MLLGGGVGDGLGASGVYYLAEVCLGGRGFGRDGAKDFKQLLRTLLRHEIKFKLNIVLLLHKMSLRRLGQQCPCKLTLQRPLLQTLLLKLMIILYKLLVLLVDLLLENSFYFDLVHLSTCLRGQ